MGNRKAFSNVRERHSCLTKPIEHHKAKCLGFFFFLIKYLLLKVSISSTSEAWLHINILYHTNVLTVHKPQTSYANLSVKKKKGTTVHKDLP